MSGNIIGLIEGDKLIKASHETGVYQNDPNVILNGDPHSLIILVFFPIHMSLRAPQTPKSPHLGS